MVAMLALCGQALSAPLQPRDIPAEAGWVVHIDADAARGGVLGGGMLRKLQGATGQGLEKLNTRLGMNLATDLHGVTIYGPSPTRSEGVCLIFVDHPTRVLEALQRDGKAVGKSIAVDGQELTAWTVRDSSFFAAIPAGRPVLVVGSAQHHVARALAMLAGHGPSTIDAPVSLMPDNQGPASGSVIFASIRPGDEPLGRSSLAQIARGLRLDLGETRKISTDAPSLFMDVRIWTTDDNSAENAQRLITGVLAFASQRVQADPTLSKDARWADVPAIVSQMQAKTDGKSVLVNMTHDAQKLLMLADAAAEMIIARSSAAAPATPPQAVRPADVAASKAENSKDH
jgi:hypothetical protein